MVKFSKMLVLSLVIIGLLAGSATAAVTVRTTVATSTGTVWGIPFESLSPTTFTSAAVNDTGIFYFTAPASAALDVVITLSNNVLVGTATNSYKLGKLVATDAQVLGTGGTVFASGQANSGSLVEAPAIATGTVGTVTGNQIKFTSVTLVAGARYIVVDAQNSGANIAAFDTINSLGLRLSVPSTSDTTDVAVGNTFTVTAAINIGGGGSNLSTTSATYGKYVMSTTYTVTKLANTIGIAFGRKKFSNNTLSDTIVLTAVGAEGTNPFMVTPPTMGSSNQIASVTFTLTGANQTAISTVKDTVTGSTAITYNATAGTWSSTDNLVGSRPRTDTFTFTVDGTDVISTASFTVGVTGTGNTSFPASYTYLTTTSGGSWSTDGFQGVVPYMSANPLFTTICFINNTTTAAVTVFADILSAESGASLTGLTGMTIGTVPAGGVTRFDFTSSILPYSFTGGAEVAGTAIPLTGLNAADRYSARLTVTGTTTAITTNCIQLDPAGSKRAVPVLTLQTGAQYYQQ